MSTKKHIIILVHGIRTFGGWQDRLNVLIKAKDATADIHIYKYKFLTATGFLIPPVRDRIVVRFREYLLENSETWKDARIDIVAHSFGTYIVAKAISSLPADSLSFGTIILSGSVLQVTFPWNDIIGRGQVRRVINDCGTQDIWPLISQIFGWRLGIAGRYGFVGVTGPDVGLINRFFPVGHSGFFIASGDFESDNSFMEHLWVPFLTSEKIPTGAFLVHPKARWFAGFEYAAEPVKLMLLVLLCFGAYAALGKFNERLHIAEVNETISHARNLQVTTPAEALVLISKLGKDEQSEAALAVKRESFSSLVAIAEHNSEYFKHWIQRGWGSKGYFQANGFGDETKDRKLLLQGFGREFKITRPPFFDKPLTLSPSCGDFDTPDLSVLTFSQDEDRILAATQAFIFIYDLEGNLLAKTCEWVTKDQWNYLGLMDGNSLLIASANEGQVMFFEISKGQIRALNNEFDHSDHDNGAIVALKALKGSDEILTTHHRGSAVLWRLDRSEKPHLIKLFEFTAPPSRPKKKNNGLIIKFEKDDSDFITSAEVSSAEIVDGTRPPLPSYFTTTYRSGPATEWRRNTDESVGELRTLDHGDATVIYAGFSANGDRIVTLAEDRSLKIWDTESGKLLVEELAESAWSNTSPR